MSTYIDTSILGAYYCPESLSTRVEAQLRRVKEPAISALTEVEFFSLVAKKRRLKELSHLQAQEVLDTFLAHIAEGHYRRLTLTVEHYIKACTLIGSFTTTLHSLDALHLALAITGKLSLLTADGALAEAAKRNRVKVTLVR